MTINCDGGCASTSRRRTSTPASECSSRRCPGSRGSTICNAAEATVCRRRAAPTSTSFVRPGNGFDRWSSSPSPTSPTAWWRCNRARPMRRPATTRCWPAWPRRTPTRRSSAIRSPRSRTGSASAAERRLRAVRRWRPRGDAHGRPLAGHLLEVAGRRVEPRRHRSATGGSTAGSRSGHRTDRAGRWPRCSRSGTNGSRVAPTRCCRWRIAFEPLGPTKTAQTWRLPSFRARWSVIGCRPSRISSSAIAPRPLRWQPSRWSTTSGALSVRTLPTPPALVDAIVHSVESHVSTVETRSATEVAVATRADGDLTVAERLADQLGSHINRAARLRASLIARPRSGGGCETCGRDCAPSSNKPMPSVANCSDVATLDQRLRRARRSRGRRAETGRPVPRQDRACTHAGGPVRRRGGHLLVDRRVEGHAVDRRSRCDGTRRHAKLERLEARAGRGPPSVPADPIDERDNLRGLLQSFRGKAASRRLGEDADLEPIYRQAESLLWTAPCDVAAARPLVEKYVAAVNRRSRRA